MSFSLSKSARLHMKSEHSPRKSYTRKHTIYNNDKLKVFIKFKPQEQISILSTLSTKQACVIEINSQQIQLETNLAKKVYTFDHVFSPDIQSRHVFQKGCEDLVNQVIDGVLLDKENNNGLVFVYGNTGTGKTYTMGLIDELGPKSQGIVPQALRCLFTSRQCLNPSQICVSFCQIYKDQVYDLLDFEQQKKLSIRESQKSKQPYIQDLIMIQVTSLKQAYQLINIGLEKRKVAEQKINKRSSRGHGIITIYMKSQNGKNTGKISFVDLAGCERIKQSESKGATLNQALHINASLSALETLLMNISDHNVRSYRSNKLTRLLQPYFQFGKIRLFVTSNYQSTQSIQFAKRCKGIKFLQRQVKKQNQKVFKTPIKSGYTHDMQILHNKSESKYMQKIQKLKKQFSLRQKVFLKCISGLVSVINKLNESVTSSFLNLSVHSNFALPELFQHLPLESKVNHKISIYECKQSEIVDLGQDTQQSQKLSQLSTNISRCKYSEKLDSEEIEKKIQEILKNMQQSGFGLIRKINQLFELTEYKNVYKKQWFTAQVKNGLLQNKNCQFQKGIQFLVGELNLAISKGSASAHRVTKRLKQFGIVLAAQQNQQNIKGTINNISKRQSISPNRNISTKSHTSIKQKQKSLMINSKSTLPFMSSMLDVCPKIYEAHLNPHIDEKTRKRSLIYIDED